MSYMIPLAFVRISPYMSICATRMVGMVSTDTLLGRRLIKEERKAKTLLNGAGKDPVKSAIIMDNGTIVASSYSIDMIKRNIVMANNKILGIKRKYTKRVEDVTEEDVVPDEDDLKSLTEESMILDDDDSEEEMDPSAYDEEGDELLDFGEEDELFEDSETDSDNSD